MIQVIKIFVIAISFALKAYVVIGFFFVATQGQAYEVFSYIPQVERNYKHFGLLAQVNALMVDEDMVVFHSFIPQQDKRE